MFNNTLFTYKTYHFYRFKKKSYTIICDNDSRLYSLYEDTFSGDSLLMESDNFSYVYEYLKGITDGTTK